MANTTWKFRLTERELQEMKDNAKAVDMTLSSYCRWKILKKDEKEVADALRFRTSES